MKKIFLLIILTLIFGINNVYADSLSQPTSFNFVYDSNNAGNWTESLATYFQTFNSQGHKFIPLFYGGQYGNNLKLFNTLVFEYELQVYNSTFNSTISLNNINIQETCTSHTDNGTTYGNNGRIVYADGTTAQIDYSQRTFYCNNFYNSGSISGTESQSIIDLNPTIDFTVIYSDLTADWCTRQNSIVSCPLRNNKDFSYIGITFSNSGANASYKLTINRNMQIYTNTTQQIINNNNQNTQTIVNNITDDNITGNDSNSAINDIGNTFDTENDFLLGLLTIPYNFFNSLMNIFEDNCTSLNLGTMFDKPLVFPCISLNNLLGNVFTNVIDIIFCGIIMSAFLRRIVKYYQALLSLDERATQIGGVKIW